MLELKDEEMKKLPKFITNKITIRPEIVAKAQLKRVVELFETENRLWLYEGKKYRGIPDELWQALLEEVK